MIEKEKCEGFFFTYSIYNDIKKVYQIINNILKEKKRHD